MNVIYISVNNWFQGRDYPETGFFVDKYDDKVDGWSSLFTDEYCKENKICACFTPYDMSQNLTISASEDWVRENCPELLEPENSKFVYKEPGKDRLGCKILEYTEENFGVHDEDLE